MNLESIRNALAPKAGPEGSLRYLYIALLVLLILVFIQTALVAWRYVALASVDSIAPATDSLNVIERAEPTLITAEDSYALQVRPVFWQSRRPLDPPPEGPTPEELAATVAPNELKELTVSGILANGEESRVIVDYKDEQKRLALGEAIDGWVLAEVSPGSVVFTSGGGRDERRLSPMPVAAASSVSSRNEESGATAVNIEEAADSAADDSNNETSAPPSGGRRLTTGGQ